MIISYPPIAFAFNPIVINVSDVTAGSVVTVSCGDHAYSRTAVGGAATFDVQAIAQTLFDRRGFCNILPLDTVLLKPFEFEVSNGDVTQSAVFDVFWGALQIGEAYSQSKVLKYYKNLPFTVPLYLTQDAIVKAKADDLEFFDYAQMSKGKHNITLELDAAHTILLLVGGDASQESLGIFDYTFDYTFRKAPKSMVLIKLVVDACSDGVYLRWINKHGEYCYYLFEEGVTSRQVKDESVTIQEFVASTDYREGYNPGTNHPQSKEVQRSIKLCAPLVDKPTFSFLESLPESPVIDMFKGYSDSGSPQWISVNIAAGTFASNESTLKDFECTILLPKSFTQSI